MMRNGTQLRLELPHSSLHYYRNGEKKNGRLSDHAKANLSDTEMLQVNGLHEFIEMTKYLL